MRTTLTITRAFWIVLLVCLAACEDDPRFDPEDHFEEGALGVLTQGMTVAEAGGCSTSIVSGLSRQLIEQINCLRPNTLEDFSRADIQQGAAVWPFVQRGGRDALWRAIDSRGVGLSLTSALRTLPQQYLLYRWFQEGRCNISLAARPGRSRHESGLAIDTGAWDAWRNALNANNWQWFGDRDVVHFDYRGANTVDLAGLSVLAFQQLWNRNNPNDQIAEDSAYGPQTEARLRQSPAAGFPISGCLDDPGPGPSPDMSVGPDPDPPADRFMTMSVRVETIANQPRDWLETGTSAGIFDLVEGQRFHVWVDLRNGTGRPVTQAVTLGYTVDAPYVDAVTVEIQTDLPMANGGNFVPVDPNANPRPLAGPDGFIDLGVLQPGETRRARITLQGVQPSIGQIRHARVRAWVRSVPGFYSDQLTWDDAVELNENVDRLQDLAEVDVLSTSRWRFEGPNAGDTEGWQTCDGGLTTNDTVERALAPNSGCVDGPPWMAIDTDRFNAVRMVVRHGAAASGTLRWRDDAGQLGSAPIQVEGGDWRTLVVPLEGAQGDVVSMQLDWGNAGPWMLDLIEGTTDQAPPDDDGDGWPAGEDCDDDDNRRFPGAPERCDMVDEDCDNQVDEGLMCDDAPPPPDAAVPPKPGDQDAGMFDPEDPFVDPEDPGAGGAGGSGFGGFDGPGADGLQPTGSAKHFGNNCQTGSGPGLWWLMCLAFVLRRRR
ncbi:MAG: MopE-related protein [Bradymonadia bacterium]